jgi:hypothetical protein
MEVVRYLEKQDSIKYTGVLFKIHTWNLMAGKKMLERLTKAGYKAAHVPFGM